MLTKFVNRSYEAELLDEPAIPQHLLFQNLKELHIVNRQLGGYAITMAGIKQLLTDKTKTYTIADIGCGGGESLLYIADWARREKYKIQLIGVDIKADAIEYLRRQCEKYPEITGVVSSYKDFLAMHSTIDIVHCSLFCHHLTDKELAVLFTSLKHVQIGFVINDLQRHWFPYYSIQLLTHLFNGSSLIKNDAPLSVLRGFKKQELQNLLAEAGIVSATVKWKWAFRYLIVMKTQQ